MKSQGKPTKMPAPQPAAKIPAKPTKPAGRIANLGGYAHASKRKKS